MSPRPRWSSGPWCAAPGPCSPRSFSNVGEGFDLDLARAGALRTGIGIGGGPRAAAGAAGINPAQRTRGFRRRCRPKPRRDASMWLKTSPRGSHAAHAGSADLRDVEAVLLGEFRTAGEASRRRWRAARLRPRCPSSLKPVRTWRGRAGAAGAASGALARARPAPWPPERRPLPEAIRPVPGSRRACPNLEPPRPPRPRSDPGSLRKGREARC